MALLLFTDGASAGDHSKLLVLLVVGVLLLAWQLLQPKIDAQEPPLVKPKVPLFGHIIGIIQHRSNYFRHLAEEYPEKPIFTLPLGPSKIYIIANSLLIQQAMRKKTVSLHPFMIEFSERMVGFSPEMMGEMRQKDSDGSEPWLNDHHKAYEMLLPGPALNEMNTHVLNGVSKILNIVGAECFTLATTDALFGVKNPLREDPKLIDALWNFETGAINLLMRPFPSLTAKKTYQGRTALQEGLRAYFKAGYDQNPDVSAIIKRRAAINRQWGLSTSDTADHELGMMFVAVTNAIPTLFWMVVYIFRDPQLIVDLQEELLKIVEEGKNTQGQRECGFSVASFADGSPLLVSVYHETMRLTNKQTGTRIVLEDTHLEYNPSGPYTGPARTYLLKKGTNIQMPTPITHFSSAVWGPDVDTFDARRFITSRDKERLQTRAFNPFGGGKHLCPGRHFAYAEILGAVAALVLGFEIVNRDGGRVAVPPANNNMIEAVSKPLVDAQLSLMANIRRRPGWEGVNWRFSTGNGSK